MRNYQVDRYIEERFGKPDWTKSFINLRNKNEILTPIRNYTLWRVDEKKEWLTVIFVEKKQRMIDIVL